jgi:glycosyltransferase involved in cell wall biosynthesis
VLSIIISSYNHERFLDETITSALRLGNSVQIFCTDDGSKDKSSDILQRYASIFENITFIQGPPENIGFAKRVNLFRYSVKSKYCMVLNSDDILITAGVQLGLKKLETFGADFFTASISIIDEDGRSTGFLNGPFEPQIPFPIAAKDALDSFDNGLVPPSAINLIAVQNWIRSSSNLIIRSDIFWQNGGISNYHFASDWALALRLIVNGNGLYSCSPFLSYRSHNSNTISRDTNQASNEVKQIFQDFIQEYPAFSSNQNFQEMLRFNPYLR